MTIYLKHNVQYVSDNTHSTDNTVIQVRKGQTYLYDGNRATAHKALLPGVYDGVVHLDAFGTYLDVVVLVTVNDTFILDGDMLPISGCNPSIPTV